MANKIKIEVDYSDSLVKISSLEKGARALKLSFDELNEATQKSSSRVKKAVDGMSDAVKGSVKSLQRQRAEHVNILNSVSKNNKAYRQNMQIIQRLDQRIAKLTDTRTAAQKAADKQKAAEDQLRKVIKGSVGDIQNQIRVLELQQQNRTKSNKQYRELQATIDELRAKEQALTDTRKAAEIPLKDSPAYYQKLIAELREEQANLANTTELYADYEQRIAAVRKEMSKLSPKFKDLTKAQVSTSHSAGAAGAAATEFTRIIQDAPYGIMGMANNVEQLTSQFVDLRTKTGSTNKAFKALFNTLFKGPNAILLVISLVTAGVTALSRRKKESEEASKDFSNAIILESDALRSLQGTLNDVNSSYEERLSVMGALGTADKKYKEQLEALTGDQEAQIKFTDDYIKATLALNKAEENRNEMADKHKDVNLDRIMSEEHRIEAQKEVARIENMLANNRARLTGAEIQRYEGRKKSLEDNLRLDKELRDAHGELTDSIDKLGKAQEELDRVLRQTEMDKYLEKFAEFQKERESTLATLGKEGSESIKIELALLKAEYQNLIDSGKQGTKEIGELNLRIKQKELERDVAIYEEEEARKQALLDLNEEYEENLYLQEDKYALLSIALERKKALAKAKELKAGKELMLKIEEYYDNLFKEKTEEFSEDEKNALEANTQLLLSVVRKQNEEKVKSYKDATKLTVEYLNKELEAVKVQYERMFETFSAGSQLIDDISQIAEQRFLREINRLQVQRDLIKSNGELSKEERDKRVAEVQEEENKIQEARIKTERDYFTVKQSIVLAEMVLQKKLEFQEFQYAQRKMIMEKKMFAERIKMNNILLVNQKRVNGEISAEEAKLQLQTLSATGAKQVGEANMSIGKFMEQLGPLGIAAFALSIGSVIASIVSARKKATAEISGLTGVAAPSSGSATANIPPDFNVVGSGNTNQLVEAINSANRAPLKAYVVSDDITSAQSLERNIVTGASI